MFQRNPPAPSALSLEIVVAASVSKLHRSNCSAQFNPDRVTACMELFEVPLETRGNKVEVFFKENFESTGG